MQNKWFLTFYIPLLKMRTMKATASRRKYCEVRKVSWDALWHAVFYTKYGQEVWDRVSQAEALKISKKLVYG